jgi:hypothetical protein
MTQNEDKKLSSPHEPRRSFLRSRFLQHDVGATFMAVLEIALCFGILLALNAAVLRAGCSLGHRGDWTAVSAKKRVYALSPKTVAFLKELQKPVHVVVFVAPPGGQQEFMHEDIKELLTRMESHTRFLSVEYVNIDTQQQRALELIKKYKLTLDRDAFASTDIGSAVGGQVVFISDDRKKAVNYFDTVKYKLKEGPEADKQDPRISAFMGEELFLNALIGVTQQRQPRICFTSGHEEASPEGHTPFDLAFASQELKRQNFSTETLTPKQQAQIPVRCDVLVVAAPKVTLAESLVSAIQAYLAKGGKLVVAPRTLDLEGKTWSRTGLEELLESYGARLEDAVAIDAAKAVQGVRIDLTTTPIAWIAEEGWDPKHPLAKAMAGKRLRVDSPRACKALPREGLEVAAVLSTSGGQEAWGERDLYGRVGFDAKRDIAGPVPVIVASRETKKNGARVVLLGTWLLVANYKLDPNMPTIDYTKELLLNMFHWLAEQESLVALAPRKPEHVKLELTAVQVNRIGRLVIITLPLFAALLGLVVWLAPFIGGRRSKIAERGGGRQGGAK